MGKTVNLKLAGLWPSPNDYSAPEGAMDVAENVVIDQKDLAAPRRGFETYYDNSGGALSGYLCRTMTATVPSVLPNVLLTYRYNPSVPEGRLLLGDADTITGNNRFLPPPGAKTCRMMNWGQYVYVSSDEGVQRYSPALNSSVAAGVPQALDLELSLSGTSGFFSPNTAKTISVSTTNTSPNLSLISDSDIANLVIGQVLQGTGIPTGTLIDDITLSAPVVIYSTALTAGAATFSVTSNSGISVNQIVTGDGIPENSRVVSVTGAGPYTITISNAAIQTAATVNVTFNSDNVILMNQNATATATGVSVVVSDGSQIGYRLVWGFRNENDAIQLGAPSGFAVITNNTGGSRDVQAIATIPDGITTDNFYQLYRTVGTASLSITPADQEQLVVEGVPDSTDISNGYITILDATPDSLKGESLYTGSDVEGIAKQNDAPPIARDIFEFRGYAIYIDPTFPHQLKLIIDGVGSPNGVQVGDDITVTTASDTFTLTASATEDTATGEFEVFTTGTPAQNIADTANSFIRVLNRYPMNDICYAYLLSGPNDLPGQMLIRARAGIGEFDIEASSNGTAWTPNIDTAQTSTAENIPNGIVVSKFQQPEAVPAGQILRAGQVGNTCIRGVPLRDYVIIHTQAGGVYRLTGQSYADMAVEPFDNTIFLVAPETAVALGNECWCLSSAGVVSISDGGARLRSTLQLNLQLQTLLSLAPQSIEDVAFAVGYESNQRYILALPDSEGDTFCVNELCYNYVTDRWVEWTRQCTAGYVNQLGGLFLANGNNDNIVKERKNGNFTDYVDESIYVQITAYSGFTVSLDTVTGLTVGDVLWQNDSGVVSYAEILAIDTSGLAVTVDKEITWQVGTAVDDTKVLQAINCVIQWKPNAAGDPTEAKQFSEGQYVFRKTRFNNAVATFATDVSPSFEPVDLIGQTGSGWGLFPWGLAPWGGTLRPKTLRFYVPSNKQYGGILIPKLTIRSGYSDWQLEGGSVTIFDVSFELGGSNG